MLKLPMDCLHILHRPSFSFLINPKSTYVTFSPILNVMTLLSSLLYHVVDTCNFSLRQNSNSILPNSYDIHHALHEPHQIHQYAYQRVHKGHPDTKLNHLQNAYPTHITAHNEKLFFFQTSTLRSIPTNQP